MCVGGGGGGGGGGLGLVRCGGVGNSGGTDYEDVTID